jgi:hypothetical protein
MASDFHRRASRLLALLGTITVSGLVVGSAAIVAQMSGCCGGAPTHGCKFIETPKDAHSDMSSDAPIPCGFQICQPGVTTCCLEANSQPPIRCIPVGTLCKGPSGNCAGNADCPSGSNQVCCGTLETMMVSCVADCPGDLVSTARICRDDSECPPNIPKCTMFTLNGLGIYACSTP